MSAFLSVDGSIGSAGPIKVSLANCYFDSSAAQNVTMLH